MNIITASQQHPVITMMALLCTSGSHVSSTHHQWSVNQNEILVQLPMKIQDPQQNPELCASGTQNVTLLCTSRPESVQEIFPHQLPTRNQDPQEKTKNHDVSQPSSPVSGLVPLVEADQASDDGTEEQGSSTSVGKGEDPNEAHDSEDDSLTIDHESPVSNDNSEMMNHLEIADKKKSEHFTLNWLKVTLIFIDDKKTAVPKEDLEEKYHAACKAAGIEPLQPQFLARLINKQFPDVTTRRVGPRGCQKKHYCNLQWTKDAERENNIVVVSSEECEDMNVEQTSSKLYEVDEDRDDSIVPYNKNQDVQPEREAQEQRYVVPQKEVEEIREEKVHVADSPKGDGNHNGESVEGNGKTECEEASEGLQKVIDYMIQQGQLQQLLDLYAHSATCPNKTCHAVCLMWRRVRRHVVQSRHKCSVLSIYSKLLRSHVASCNSNSCGLPSCPTIRAKQGTKRVQEDLGIIGKRLRRSSVGEVPTHYIVVPAVLVPVSEQKQQLLKNQTHK